jgi:hypothetical protein
MLEIKGAKIIQTKAPFSSLIRPMEEMLNKTFVLISSVKKREGG